MTAGREASLNEPDLVVLHALPKAYKCPCMSPYPLKLETFLRILGIKYVVDYNKPRGSKGRSPWINFNGQELTDSQLILEYLSRYFEKDLDGRLDDTDRAIARMTRVMVEERYYWCGALERYREGQGLKDKELFAPFPFVPRFLDGFVVKCTSS